MLNTRTKQQGVGSAICWVACGWLISYSAYTLEISRGQLIQTVDPVALKVSSTFTVSKFFDDAELRGKVRDDLIAADAETIESHQNIFTLGVHGTDFVIGHPDRTPSINSFPSQFTFDTADVLKEAENGRIGLGGVMRLALPPSSDGTPRYFMLGDWTLEYNPSRKNDFNLASDETKPIKPSEHNVSGWFMRNHIDFPAIAFDVLDQTIFTNSDSFYLSGNLAWSPEMTIAFLPDSALYTNVSKIVMCGQDDKAVAAQTTPLIPCVFPNITLNGQSGTVSVGATEPLKIEANLGVATNDAAKVEYFVAFVHQDTVYWLNPRFKWTTIPTAVHQDSLIDFRGVSLPSPAQVLGTLTSGTAITLYFGLDSTQNGQFDPPYRFSSATLTIN